MDKREYKTCPFCECTLLALNYERHLQEQHNPEAELKKIEARNKIEENRRIKAILGEYMTFCDLCGTEVKLKNLNKHIYNAHKKKK